MCIIKMLHYTECLAKRSHEQKVVSVKWECVTQKYIIDVRGTDLCCLQQWWETNTLKECWLNDNVTPLSTLIKKFFDIFYYTMDYTILISNNSKVS